MSEVIPFIIVGLFGWTMGMIGGWNLKKAHDDFTEWFMEQEWKRGGR